MMRRIDRFAGAFALALILAACSPAAPPASETPGAADPNAPLPEPAGQIISSGGNAEALVDGSTETFWISPETGASVKGHAWFGYAFEGPQTVRTLVLTQSNNLPYRQDSVTIQSSNDQGATWTDVTTVALPIGAPAEITVPASAPAAYWRILAAGDNATAPAHAWTPLEVKFSVN